MTILAHGAHPGPTPAEPVATPGDVTQLWAERQIDALGVTSFDEYGSAAWLKLRADDPGRAAAIVEAAELWRRHLAYEAWLDQLLDDEPERWFSIVTAEADRYARRIAGTLARQPTAAEMTARRAQQCPAHRLKATAGWPPIAIPGQPGRYLTFGQEAAA